MKSRKRGFPDESLETHPERPFLANDDIENKGLLGREIAKKRLSGFVSSLTGMLDATSAATKPLLCGHLCGHEKRRAAWTRLSY